MKDLRLFYVLLGFALGTVAVAQPQWRFHLAFEDATGARDTIWLLFDTNATIGSNENHQVDTALGEGRVEMDTSAFNVWKYNWDFDSTKTVALPYTIFPVMQAQINAFHWQAPMILRWDRSLFHAPQLPAPPDTIGAANLGGMYFFFNNNDPWLQAFNMLIDDSTVVTTDADLLFPISLYFGPDGRVGVNELDEADAFMAWPDPLGEGPLHVRSNVPCQVWLFDQRGHCVVGPLICNGFCSIDVSQLNAGSYLLRAATTTNRIHYAKLIK